MYDSIIALCRESLAITFPKSINGINLYADIDFLMHKHLLRIKIYTGNTKPPTFTTLRFFHEANFDFIIDKNNVLFEALNLECERVGVEASKYFIRELNKMFHVKH